ncbi:MATE family efflux transporter [Reyranella sp. CPCC 100927]|nr:MATE family efflux transporter [Reyranella sp. CPCC 100927]
MLCVCAVSSEFLVSHPLLTAPIGPALLRLAGPTTGVMVLQMLVAVADIYFVGRLGTDALAGMALVFPFMALMVNNANGGIGGGVAAALARALGAGRHDDANALVFHALILGAAFGLGFTILAWAAAPAFYRLLGGSGPALTQALAFSDVWYCGAIAVWLAAFIAALLRGSGNAAASARITVIASLVYVPLAGALTLGTGDWPGWGMVGLAIASIATSIAAALLLAQAVWRGGLGFMPTLRGVRLQRRLFADILHVGIISVLGTLIASVAAMVMTGLVGQFGATALAGYGVGVRLEFMLAPLAFGIGTGLTTLVGVAAGADDWKRAMRATWIGGLVAFGFIGAIGWTVALLPETWSRLFTSDPPVIATSVSYITHVAPFFCLFGLGLTLHFASQGAGRMVVPFLASVARLVVATVGGWLAIVWGMEIAGVFVAIAIGIIVYGVLIAGTLLLSPWRSTVPPERSSP